MSKDLVTTGDNAPSGSEPAHDLANGVPVTHGATLSRAEIERIRDTDIDRYFAQGLDRQLLHMIREDLGEVGPTDPMSVEASRTQMMETPEGAKFVMEMERSGGFRMQLQRLQGTIGGLVRDLGDERSQQVFMERFDRSFPEPIRYAIYDQLVMGRPSFVVPVTDDKVKEFAGGDPGRELVREWGSDAPEMIATIWKRVDNLKAAIGEDGMDTFKDWFNSLEIPHMKRVLQFIARGI
ncbi:hypothetical protein [Rhizobium leguminosarum]|uniref:hypothetical protein n=1 Tax=Rhizobium leguminosarum TaxID=384 RepID=UPI001FE06946|nr:hypothetical protein [Rhizobium leguminosarum]